MDPNSDLGLDPRWHWVDVTSVGSPPGSAWVRGECRHLEQKTEPGLVRDLDGVWMTTLCRTCGRRWNVPAPRWHGW